MKYAQPLGPRGFVAIVPGEGAVRALAARQSRHSVAEFAPIENPLNDFPQVGQVGMLGTLWSSPRSVFRKTNEPVVNYQSGSVKGGTCRLRQTTALSGCNALRKYPP